MQNNGIDCGGNGNGISWECQNHEEAVSAQNYGPIIVACTPRELVASFIRTTGRTSSGLRPHKGGRAGGPEGPVAPIVTTGSYSVKKQSYTSSLHCGPCRSSLRRSGKKSVSSLCRNHANLFCAKQNRIKRVILLPGTMLKNAPHQKHQELSVSSLRKGHANLKTSEQTSRIVRVIHMPGPCNLNFFFKKKNESDVETAGGTCSVACSAPLTFFMFGSTSETGSNILSCASLTRTLRATSDDMALMIRILHCAV